MPGPFSIFGWVLIPCRLSRAGLECPRYQRHFRRCTFCATNAFGDKRHCVFDCPHFQGFRHRHQQYAGIFQDCHGAMRISHVAQGTRSLFVLLCWTLSMRPRQHDRFVLKGLCWLYGRSEFSPPLVLIAQGLKPPSPLPWGVCQLSTNYVWRDVPSKLQKPTEKGFGPPLRLLPSSCQLSYTEKRIAINSAFYNAMRVNLLISGVAQSMTMIRHHDKLVLIGGGGAGGNRALMAVWA